MSKKAKFTVKDSVFTDLFSSPKYLVRLYQALHPEAEDVTEEDISDITLKNILVSGLYNDLSFRVGDSILVMMEAQSTWSENIVVRIFLYLAEMYNNYIYENGIDRYGSKKMELPRPELYVIYTGDREERPDYLSLKEDFFGGQDIPIDVRVNVICDSSPGDIVDQYIRFTKIIDRQIRDYGRTGEAVTKAIAICKKEGILPDYLEEREVEVMDIMTSLFDQGYAVECYAKTAAKAAFSDGQNILAKAVNRLKEGATVEDLRREGYQEETIQLALSCR